MDRWTGFTPCFTHPDNGRTIQGPYALAQQVLWNLLKNAAKFTPEGGEITVRSRNEWVASDNPDRIVIEVSDSGIGFDAEAADRIFEPFIQANGLITQRFGGLGLGLAISKATVDAHGGTIPARELGIDRETVGRYLLLTKPAILTTGIEGTGEAKPGISTAGKGIGRKSQCEPLAQA